MRKTENYDVHRSGRNDAVLLCLCFVASALIGYLLTHHVALFGF
ncbi:MAG: hypothetical protein NWE99_10335 [Candidatus Bathyarchaeota archaeon]|nr:hypothetical protein [Candidatus Bathyarchaeota archaeon]